MKSFRRRISKIIRGRFFSYDFIENLAFNKAKAVIPLVKEPSLIIGADTVVVIDNEILGKPDGYEGAFKMLKRLSCRTHIVVTSIVVINSETGDLKKKTQQQVKLRLKILLTNRLNIILIILSRLTKRAPTEYKKCPKDI